MPHNTTNAREIAKQAVNGTYDIPEFQRGFVWSPEKVKNLLDSLCRDYPLGSILCWRADEYQSARTAASTEGSRVWIVDGQQRTTALCLLLGKRPYWFPAPDPWNSLYKKCDVHVDLHSDPNDIQLSLPNPIIASTVKWVSVRDLLNLTEADIPAKALELLQRLCIPTSDVGALSRVMSIIQVLQGAMRRELVIIEISHDPVDVAEIFGRLNSAGTRVNEGDIALALIAVRQEGWVREKLLPYIEDLEEQGFSFDPSFIIRSMAAIRQGVARLRDVPRDFWAANPEFSTGWDRTKKSVNNVVRVLREVGILSSELLPARNALIPLFVLDNQFGDGNAASLRKAFFWLLRAIRGGRYSGSAATTIAQDLTTIRSSVSFDAALTALNSTLDTHLTFVPEDFLRRYDEEPFMRLMLYLMVFNRKAEDWKTGQRLGFDKTDNQLNDGFRPEWHHFVPRGLLKRRHPESPSDELINCLANIVVLSEGDNRRFSYSEPQKYLAKYNVPDERVHQQVFPDRSQWSSAEFEQFVEKRSQLLAVELNGFAQRLQSGKW